MSEKKEVEAMHQENSFGTKKTYLTGFLLSLALTLIAYIAVTRHVDSHHTIFTDEFLMIWVGTLAICQLVVQLVFFLHLGRESKPRWNLTVLAFAAMVVLILVGGSLWIMWNLDAHHEGYGTTHDGHQLESPQQTNQYIIRDEGIQN